MRKVKIKKLFIATILMILFKMTTASASKESDMAYYSGKAKYESSNYKGALHDLTKAIEFDTKDSKLFFLRGMAYFQLEKTEEAIQDISVAIALNSKISEYYYQKANMLSYQEDFKLAYFEINKAIKLDQKNSKYYKIRADIEIELGYKTDARDDYNMVNKL